MFREVAAEWVLFSFVKRLWDVRRALQTSLVCHGSGSTRGQRREHPTKRSSSLHRIVTGRSGGGVSAAFNRASSIDGAEDGLTGSCGVAQRMAARSSRFSVHGVKTDRSQRRSISMGRTAPFPTTHVTCLPMERRIRAAHSARLTPTAPLPSRRPAHFSRYHGAGARTARAGSVRGSAARRSRAPTAPVTATSPAAGQSP